MIKIDSSNVNYEIYTRNKKDCYEIDTRIELFDLLIPYQDLFKEGV